MVEWKKNRQIRLFYEQKIIHRHRSVQPVDCGIKRKENVTTIAGVVVNYVLIHWKNQEQQQ